MAPCTLNDLHTPILQMFDLELRIRRREILIRATRQQENPGLDTLQRRLVARIVRHLVPEGLDPGVLLTGHRIPNVTQLPHPREHEQVLGVPDQIPFLPGAHPVVQALKPAKDTSTPLAVAKPRRTRQPSGIGPGERTDPVLGHHVLHVLPDLLAARDLLLHGPPRNVVD